MNDMACQIEDEDNKKDDSGQQALVPQLCHLINMVADVYKLTIQIDQNLFHLL